MKKITTNLLSILYTLFVIIGVSFIFKGNFSLITNSITNIICSIISFVVLFIFFKKMIIILCKYIDNYKQKTTKPVNKFLIFFEEHPILFSTIFMFICWLPYIIAFYPGILNRDNVFQVKQFFGIDNKYSYYVNLIDSSQIITNHHPYFHTILLGSCVKLGSGIKF